MCRNIKPLFNFEPPATRVEIQAAALQFVRKVSGSSKPSQANEFVFHQAVNDVSKIIEELLPQLQTQAEPKNREVEAAKAKARAQKRFARV